jgi:hypothetical protein
MDSRTYRAMTVAIASALLVAACSSEPTIQQGDDAEVVMGALNRVDNAQFDLAYVDPSIDYQRYQSVLLQPLDVNHVEIRQPKTTSATLVHRNDWEPSDEDRETLQSIYREYTVRAINESSRFSLTEESGPDVILVEAMLTEIAPTAPIDDTQSRGVGRSRIYTDSAGTVSIAIALRDGRSGEVLALIKDTRGSDTTAWQLNNRTTNMAELRRIFSRWGENLRGGLERLSLISSEHPGPK